MDDAAHLLWLGLGAVAYPLWLTAGALDYACHRREHIEHSTGSVEPLLHLAQAGQVGVGLLAVLFLEVTGALLALLAACAVVHTTTAYLDIAYAAARRRIGATEQFAHALLIGFPLLAWVALASLHLLGEANGASGLVLRSARLHGALLAAVLASGVAVAVLPALLEGARARSSLQARRRIREGSSGA